MIDTLCSETFKPRVFFVAALCAVCFLHVLAATSPDGRTAFDFTVADGAPVAAVRYDGRPVATVCFGLDLAEPFADGFETADVKTRTVESGWKTVRGDRAEVKDAFAEETVTLREKGPKSRRLVLELRAYDEGFAFRYRLLADGAWEIRDDLSSVTFPAGTAAWGIDSTEATLPEKPFPIRPFPADAKRRTLLMPLTVQVPGAGCASLLEAYVVSFPRAELTPFADGVKLALLGGRPAIVKGPFTTPWRALVLGKDAAGLVDHSTLVLNLNPPCAIKDTGWIKPGLTVSNLSNCRLTEEDLEAVADRECTNNVRYLQLDWGWYGTEWGWSDADRARYLATNPDMKDEPTWGANTTGNARRAAKGIVPYTPGWVRSIPVDFDMQKLVRYLKDRGMGLCLYVRGVVLEKENVDDLFALYETWGVAGVKPGFVRYGDAEATDWNREIVRLAAKHHLWVDVHDAQIPDGLERTYPNLFLTEGGGGEEGKHPVRQDVTLPFTRCLAGPFDYTPMFFFAGRSHTHLAAMLLAYPGPSAVLRGKTSDRFGSCPGFAWGMELDIVKRLPMTYDESHVLDAEIGQRIALARRTGDTWFAAGVNGAEAHTVTLNCGFLTPGRIYEMKLVRDDLADDGPSRRSVAETRRVTCADLVDVPMAAAGGFLATFDPVPPCQGDRGISRERIRSLNGTGWTCDGLPVTVPHGWNIGDGADGLDVPKENRGHRSVSSPSYERKKVCYARTLPDPVKGRRTFVKCEGASVKAEMRVNGKVAGCHAGAYTAFCFEVTDLLEPSGNRLEIDVDNAYDPDLPPNEADFTVCGGLYRNVWLIETPRVCIDPTVDGGPGVAINADPDTGRVTARVTVSGGTNEVQTFDFANPKLWRPEAPNLYALTVKIRQGGCEDEVTETFGFRKAEFREDGFYLNGKKRQIHGVCRHQDRLGKGWAVSAADEAEDIRWMKRMGADGVRTSHYPNSPSFYDLCDRNGLLVWTEIPVVDDRAADGSVQGERDSDGARNGDAAPQPSLRDRVGNFQRNLSVPQAGRVGGEDACAHPRLHPRARSVAPRGRRVERQQARSQRGAGRPRHEPLSRLVRRGGGQDGRTHRESERTQQAFLRGGHGIRRRREREPARGHDVPPEDHGPVPSGGVSGVSPSRQLRGHPGQSARVGIVRMGDVRPRERQPAGRRIHGHQRQRTRHGRPPDGERRVLPLQGELESRTRAASRRRGHDVDDERDEDGGRLREHGRRLAPGERPRDRNEASRRREDLHLAGCAARSGPKRNRPPGRSVRQDGDPHHQNGWAPYALGVVSSLYGTKTSDEINIHQLEMGDVGIDRGFEIDARLPDVDEVVIERREVIHAPQLHLSAILIDDHRVLNGERRGTGSAQTADDNSPAHRTMRPRTLVSFSLSLVQFAGHGRAVTRQLAFEIPEAGPLETAVEIHFGHDDGSPLFSLRQRLSGVVENRRDHPVARKVLVRAADEIDLVLARAGACEKRVAPPDGPSDHLRPAIAQFAGDFRKKAVVADHHADLAETGREDGIVVSRRDSPFDLAARQRDLAILAGHTAVGRDQNRDVVNQVPFPFDETGHDVEVVPLRQLAEIGRGRSGDRLGAFGFAQARIRAGQHLRQDHEVGSLPGRLSDERRELAAVVHRRLAALRPEMYGGQAHVAARRSSRLGKR